MNPPERLVDPKFPRSGSFIPVFVPSVVAETNIRAKHDQLGGKCITDIIWKSRLQHKPRRHVQE